MSYEPIQTTAYQLCIEHAEHEDHPITRLYLHNDSEIDHKPIASGYGGLNECFPSIEDAARHFTLLAAAPLLLSALIKVVESHDNLVERLSNMQDQGHTYMRIPSTPAGYEEAKAAIAQALNIKTEQP